MVVGIRSIGQPKNSLELTGLSWSFARLVQVAAKVGEPGHRAWAALQLSSDRYLRYEVV